MKKRSKVIVVISCLCVLVSVLLVNCFALIGPGETYPIVSTLINGVTVEWNKSPANMPNEGTRDLIPPYYTLPVSNGYYPGGVDNLIIDSTETDVILPYVDIDDNYYTVIDMITTQSDQRNEIQFVLDEYESDLHLGDNPIRSVKVDVADSVAHNGEMPYISFNSPNTDCTYELGYTLYVPVMFSILREDFGLIYASVDVPVYCYIRGIHYNNTTVFGRVGDYENTFVVPDIVFNSDGTVADGNNLPNNYRIEGFSYTSRSSVVGSFITELENHLNGIPGVSLVNYATYSIYYRDCFVIFSFTEQGAPFDFSVKSSLGGVGGVPGTRNYTSNSGETIVEEVQVEPFDWIIQVMQGVLDTQLFGSITIGHLLMVAIAVPLLLAILRAIAGG